MLMIMCELNRKPSSLSSSTKVLVRLRQDLFLACIFSPVDRYISLAKHSPFFTLILAHCLIVLPAFSTMTTPELKELKHKLKLEIESEQSSCLSSLPLAKAVYSEDQKHLLALQTIVKCTSSERNVSHYAMFKAIRE